MTTFAITASSSPSSASSARAEPAVQLLGLLLDDAWIARLMGTARLVAILHPLTTIARRIGVFGAAPVLWAPDAEQYALDPVFGEELPPAGEGKLPLIVVDEEGREVFSVEISEP